MRRGQSGKAAVVGVVAACFWAVATGFSGARANAEEGIGRIIELRLRLPNGTVYRRGATDPVAGLTADLQMVNLSKPFNRIPLKKKVTVVRRLSPEEEYKVASDKSLLEGTKDEIEAKIKQKCENLKVDKTIEIPPTNPDSFGIAYAPPKLGPQDLVRAVIVPVREGEEAGAAVGEGAAPKPVPARRDMPVEYTAQTDAAPTAYLAPGATSPVYHLPVGKFYLIKAPGLYRLTIELPAFRDPRSPLKCIRSNPVTFRVLPYKAVGQKLEYLKRHWAEFERGEPNFEYMFYELPTDQPYRAIYYVRKIPIGPRHKYEFHRLCSLVPNGRAQVRQLTPKKIALLVPHMDAAAGLYVVDFSTLDPTVETRLLPLKPGRKWKLTVEGETATATPSDGGAAVSIGTKKVAAAAPAGAAGEAPAPAPAE